MYFGPAPTLLPRRLLAGAAAGLCAWLSVSPSRAQQPPPLRGSPSDRRIDQAVLLDGKPFPAVRAPSLRLPEAKRTFFVAPGKEAGNGTEGSPWTDLQAALRRLAPGDRLRVRTGAYRGPLEIGDSCRDGSERQPIQLVFDGKATVEPGEGKDAGALILSRAHWLVVGLYATLGGSAAPGVLVKGRGAHDVRLEGTRLADGVGPSIRVDGDAARVAISGAYVSKTNLKTAGPGSCAVEVLGGAREVSLESGHFSNNPAGSIRVRAPEARRNAARDLEIRNNTFRDDGATTIAIEAADGVTISGNTITDATGVAGTRGVAFERVERGSVRANRISGFAIGIAVGFAEPKGGPYRAASDVVVERNGLLDGGPGTAAFVVEAGTRVRMVNNLADGYADGVLLFGAPPQTERVVVANNVFLGVSDVALMMQSPSAATLFDYNVFSPLGAPTVEIAGRAQPLTRFLKEGSMPHTQIKRGVQVVHRDLARLSGLPTVDRGTKVEGLQFRGAAPDLGPAER